MKKLILFTFALSATVMMTSCKSQESAYRKAFLKAQANQSQTDNTSTVAITNQDEDVSITPVRPTITTPPAAEPVDMTDVRQISGGMTLVSGNALKTYSVVVGSFVSQANAEGLRTQLRNAGYDARVIKTNETINGQTGWYRVIADSFDYKNEAVSKRDILRSKYAGAWLLYSK